MSHPTTTTDNAGQLDTLLTRGVVSTCRLGAQFFDCGAAEIVQTFEHATHAILDRTGVIGVEARGVAGRILWNGNHGDHAGNPHAVEFPNLADASYCLSEALRFCPTLGEAITADRVAVALYDNPGRPAPAGATEPAPVVLRMSADDLDEVNRHWNDGEPITLPLEDGTSIRIKREYPCRGECGGNTLDGPNGGKEPDGDGHDGFCEDCADRVACAEDAKTARGNGEARQCDHADEAGTCEYGVTAQGIDIN